MSADSPKIRHLARRGAALELARPARPPRPAYADAEGRMASAESAQECALCQVPATAKCGRCKNIWFCSELCQKTVSSLGFHRLCTWS